MLKTASTSITLVVSAGQSRNPDKRALEKGLAEQAAAIRGVNVVQIPHLYDLAKDSESFETVRKIDGDLIVAAWLFDRATHWVLDRNDIRGQFGEVELRQLDDDEDFEQEQEEAPEDTVTNSQPRPARSIYCVDFRSSENITDFVEEVKRIAEESLVPDLEEASERYANPANDTYVGSNANANGALFGDSNLLVVDEHPGRRWYPVIDFSRCTNCMECIDFCLFGVYGVDTLETIVVEQADNCRKGCPACSRVCPQNAIMFPQHKTPAIAGAPVDSGGLKIDLSKLFGAPESDEDAAAVAARERDEQLILAGRQAVGDREASSTKDQINQRLADSKEATQASGGDGLDDLLNELDSLDL